MTQKKFYKDAFERIDDSRKNKLLEIAIDEFASKGYKNANINIIAKNAGISIGLMYKYFATKDDLYITCLKHGMDLLDKSLYEIMQSDDKLLVKTEKLIRTICAHSKSHSKYIRLYNEIGAEKGASERTRMMVEEIETKRSSIYITTIAQALANGDVRDDLDPRLFAYFLDNLLTMLQFAYTCDYYRERFMIFTGVDINEADDEKIISQLLSFIESAFTVSHEELKKL